MAYKLEISPERRHTTHRFIQEIQKPLSVLGSGHVGHAILGGAQSHSESSVTDTNTDNRHTVRKEGRKKRISTRIRFRNQTRRMQ